MSAGDKGLLIAALLAVVAVAIGFWQALCVAVAMALGWAAGKAMDGSLDVAALVEALRGRSRS